MDVSTLAGSVRGSVLRPDDEGYAEEVAAFNLSRHHTPDVVVVPRSADDVVATVRWAGENDLPVSVQATGHGAVLPITEGVLVSTRGLDELAIDPERRTARVGAGVKWRRVIDAAAEVGLAGLCGSTSDVGVIGYTLGGGLPLLGRAYGFSSDHVRSIDVVTGDGRLHHVETGDGSELDWALRGGKGNLGVVTAMEVELFAIPDLYGGAVFWPGALAPTLLPAFVEWTKTLPDDFSASISLLRLPPLPEVPEPLRGQFTVHLRVAYVGSDADGERLLAPMRAVAPPMIDLVGRMPYVELDRIHMDPEHPVPFEEGGMVLREMGPDTIATILEHAGPDTRCPLLLVEVRLMGGALARAHDDAVGGRDAAYTLFAVGALMPPIADAVPGAISSLMAACAPWSTGGTMVNFHGVPGDAADRARPWPPATFERLQRAKATHDPANLFRFGHSIPVLDPA
ncbi:MAG TPA: FAD-binding oxidoreductase [Nocardioides sp.]|jgi:FAD/FMN-containing dehydrogenase|nr:FAD-binding oxidoreductase [Nocardioides sp.]